MRIFLGQVLDEPLIVKYNLPFAADAFSRNLVSGGAFDKVYTILATNVKGYLGHVTEDGYKLIYSDWRKKGGLRAKLSFIHEQWLLFKKITRHDSIWLYNLNYLNFVLFILLALFKPSVKKNVIVMDFTPSTKKFCMANFFLWLCNKADGTICLSQSDLFTVKNTACLAGVVPNDTKQRPVVEKVSSDFLISGNLNEQISMLRSVLIPAFKRMPNMRLHISGIAHDEARIKEMIAGAENIVYHGRVSYDEYSRLLNSIPFLFSTRNPEFPENQCNFPSKVIEGLLHNRIIISTIHYNQLNGVKYYEVPTDVEGFVNLLTTLDLDDSLRYANQGSLVIEMFSTKRWNDTIKQIEDNE